VNEQGKDGPETQHLPRHRTQVKALGVVCGQEGGDHLHGPSCMREMSYQEAERQYTGPRMWDESRDPTEAVQRMNQAWLNSGTVEGQAWGAPAVVSERTYKGRQRWRTWWKVRKYDRLDLLGAFTTGLVLSAFGFLLLLPVVTA